MSDVTIWHNQRCSKSRGTMALLEQRGLQPNVVKYLEDPPSADQIQQVLTLLDLTPRELMRTHEAEYREHGLDDVTDDQALIQAMVDNPILIQRPIVISNGRAAIGRPPETVVSILDD